MKIKDLKKHRKILILGYGKEGQATEKFLKKHIKHADISIADKKQGPDYLSKQKEVNLVIKTPGIPKEKIKEPYTTATNIFFANVKGKTIAVTGSKGKSTTASLIFQILKTAGHKAHLVGNIGNPMLAGISKTNKKDDIFVIELSSYQLDDIKYSPEIAVMTNAFSVHLDYHGNFDKYLKAKKNIIKYQNKNDFFVFNQKFDNLKKIASDSKAKKTPIIDKIPFSIDKCLLKGQHNVENIKTALTVAKLLNVKNSAAEKAVNTFAPLPHRLNDLGIKKGIRFINDASSTVPEATIVALKTYDSVDTIMLGGTDSGFKFASLAKEINKANVKNVILFPDTGGEILQELNKTNYIPENILFADNMKDAVKFAYKYTRKGKICLLSTACPSFSLWKNYKDRGEKFVKFVKKYSG